MSAYGIQAIRASDKYAVLLSRAAAGDTLDQAASAVDMQPEGVRKMLWRRRGSSVWPPK